MPIAVEGITYFSAVEVVQDVGVSRQTLWRWRQEGKVPAGRRYRDKQVLFTPAELDQIRQHANRIEPLDGEPSSQFGLSEGQGGSDAENA